MATVTPDPWTAEQQIAHLRDLGQKCPTGLASVVQALIAEVELARQGVAMGRVRARQVRTSLGIWTVGRFVGEDTFPWVALSWPKGCDRRTVSWLIKRMANRSMLTSRTVPEGQVWLFLNRQ